MTLNKHQHALTSFQESLERELRDIVIKNDSVPLILVSGPPETTPPTLNRHKYINLSSLTHSKNENHPEIHGVRSEFTDKSAFSL